MVMKKRVTQYGIDSVNDISIFTVFLDNNGALWHIGYS